MVRLTLFIVVQNVINNIQGNDFITMNEYK